MQKPNLIEIRNPHLECEVYVERIRLDRQGYTRDGVYFGVGEPLFRVDVGDDYTYVRSPDRPALRAELKRTYPLCKISR